MRVGVLELRVVRVGDSRPIHIQETPNSTSSSALYLPDCVRRGEDGIPQALPSAFMSSSRRIARVPMEQEIFVHHEKGLDAERRLAWHMTL